MASLVNLPEDTCIAIKSDVYFEDDSERICMKERRDKIHLPIKDCFMCPQPNAHHEFVMGVRPKEKVRCMSDMWD